MPLYCFACTDGSPGGAPPHACDIAQLHPPLPGWLRHTPTRRRSRSVRIPHAVQQQSIHGDTRGVVQVRFHVPGFRLAGYGDTLRVCGENAVLGSWSVAAAPRMRWEAGDNWSVTLPLAPGTHEFKVGPYAGSDTWALMSGQ